ncbi:MAG: extracellular solute-binding protein [Treponema sp.]|jgi:multiple sugar transport system substrate-binding protein|nr:extracellular solute-binding protein [Treponema sp.]
MKKLISVALIFSLVLVSGSLFAGGKQDTSGGTSGGGEVAIDMNEDGTINNPEDVKTDPNKLVFWSLFSGGDGTYMDKIIADYNKTSPVKQIQSVMLVWGDYYTKLGTAVAARRGPDLGVAHESRLPELVDQGLVIPIDKYVQKTGLNWNEYAQATQDSVTFNGQKYAVPLDTFTAVVFINVDKLNAAGIPLTNNQLSVKSPEEFKAILDKIKSVIKPDESTIAFSQTGDDPWRYWWAVYHQMGGTPFIDAAGKQVTMDKAIAVKAAAYVRSFWTDGYVLPGIDDPYKFFQAGSAAMLFGFSWNTGVMASTAGLKMGAQPFPILFNKEVYWGGSHNLAIPVKRNRSEADTQAAVDFLVYASTRGSSTWAESGQIPANQQTRTSPAFLNLPFRKDYAKAASAVAFLPKDRHSAYFDRTASSALDLIWTGQVTPEQGIENLYTDISDLIRR